MNFFNKGDKTIIAVNDIAKQWSNDPIKIVVNSNRVSDFYPSRVNIEYVSDSHDNLYLVKNKGWDSYLGIPTVLDSNFDDEQKITDEELSSGRIESVHRYNELVLSTAYNQYGIENPDSMDMEEVDKGIQYVVKSMDELMNTYKYIEQGKSPSHLTNGDVVKLSHITLNLEVLGSVYMLYRARKRLLKRR